MPKPRHKTKFTLAEVEAALERFHRNGDLLTPHREIIEYYLTAEINRRSKSAKNPGRPKVLCVCGDALSEHLEGKCPHCPCDLGSGQGGG